MPVADMLVVGVDPGARHTGVALRQGRRFVGHQVIEVAGHREKITAAHLQRVVDAVQAELEAAPVALLGDPRVIVAVEDVVDPTPHMGTIAVGGLLGTAKVLGALTAHVWRIGSRQLPPAVLVKPGNNGSGMLGSYPADLITAQERKKGLIRPAGQSSLLRHCRSAWDVAGQGPMYARNLGLTR